LYDEEYICQFPSAMGLAATGSLEIAFDVAKATATEVSAVGVNMILGPVLDVLTNARYQPLGVRATGDDPQEVSQYGIASMNGYKDAGISTCGKHFPSYGNLDFLGSSLDMPIITETLEQLSLSALVPFRNAVAAGVDAIMVGGCAIANSGMNVMHACLSEQVVDDLLRRDLGFDGVVISECLEMDALSHDIGVRGGTVMAVEAGCDLVLLCRSFSVQQEAISGLKIGIENDMVSTERLRKSVRRVLRLKSACTSWQQALNPPGIGLLSTIHESHLALSKKAYDNSITVMRDDDRLLPLSNTLRANEELLLLTPLLKPLPASAATKFLSEQKTTENDRWMDRSAIMSGEGVFRELGRSLAKRRHGKLLHTSYTANGVRPTHEHLIERASAIIVVTADANRNLYQNGFTKHVNMMSSMIRATGKKKSLIVVSVSSPYDFAMDKSISTYLCTYDFTEAAMAALVRVLFGEFVPQGTLPGTIRRSRKVQKTRQNWLVETWNAERDSRGLDALIAAVRKAAPPETQSPLSGATALSFELFDPAIEEAHFFYRNSSTKALYGFCATYFRDGVGYIGAIFVDPAKRNLSLGHSLYQRAIRGLQQKNGIRRLRLGIGLPYIYPGVPDKTLVNWFANNGWTTQTSTQLHSCVIRNLPDWSPPDVKQIQRVAVDFDLVHGLEHFEELSQHVGAYSTWEILELYKIALSDSDACGVLRARSRTDGTLIGSVIICRHGSKLSTYVPFLQSSDSLAGGVLSPVISSAAEEPLLLLQGLLTLGVRQNRAHRASTSYLNRVSRFSLLKSCGRVLSPFTENGPFRSNLGSVLTICSRSTVRALRLYQL
jgi:beta-N-acetylhexosaminidase